MNIISLITNNMTSIIIFFAICEVFLFLRLGVLCNKQSKSLLDSLVNISKGYRDVPDQRNGQSYHDRSYALISYLERKLASRGTCMMTMRKNVSLQLEKNTIADTYKIEVTHNLSAALVQLFPLLGILGTVLSLSQVSIINGALKASDVTSSFVIAIDTTVLGMAFAVIFMLWESKLQAKINRTLTDSNNASTFFSSTLIQG